MKRAELIQLYYTEGKTLQEIADKFGVTRERVRQQMEAFKLPRYTKRARRTQLNKAAACPWCNSGNVYYRSKTDDFRCRHCSRTGKRAKFIKGGTE